MVKTECPYTLHVEGVKKSEVFPLILQHFNVSDNGGIPDPSGGEWISEYDYDAVESFIGHEDTARLLNVPMNRKTATLQDGELCYVAQLQGGRLPEGATRLPDGFEFKFYRITVEVQADCGSITEEPDYNPAYAVINGIKLKRENETLRYCEQFSFEEAQDIAGGRSLRLPTKEEWESLTALGSTWDDKRKGRWIGENHAMKKETAKSTFLPAAGYRGYSDGSLGNQGTVGYYWSSTPNGSYAYSLTFDSSAVNPGYNDYHSDAFSVRCVAD